MDFKTLAQMPTVADTILIELETLDKNGKLVNPYSVEWALIYFIERDYTRSNYKVHENNVYEHEAFTAYHNFAEGLGETPTEAELEHLQMLKEQADLAVIKSNSYYKDTKLVMGTDVPLWAKGKEDNKISNITKKDKPVAGKFGFYWKPTELMKSGDYIIRWCYKPTEDSRAVVKERKFVLYPDQSIKTNYLTRYTPRDKYQMLMDRYLPSMYKSKIRSDDLTPAVMQKLNDGVAQELTLLEDYANQLIDMLDANVVPAPLLPLLANMLDVHLRSEDIALWRRQIKNAVPLYKKKGTEAGLREALAQAGIKLHRLKRLWQVTSQYNWIDSFIVTPDIAAGDSIGELTHAPLGEIQVSLRTADSYVKLPADAVITMPSTMGTLTLIWNGHGLHPRIDLLEGDHLKVQYQYKEIPSKVRAVEEYINSLPLADRRDENQQHYPLKNWNVRLIEEDDPLFATIITERHPFYDPVVFGRTRTSFLYSEKAYNMDTYDGSLKESHSPCDLDKDFMDPCSYCQSSKFNVELEIQDLSDDRLREAREIIEEFSPFHAILNSMKTSGKVTDYILPPLEKIEVKSNPGINKESIDNQESINVTVTKKDGTTNTSRLL